MSLSLAQILSITANILGIIAFFVPIVHWIFSPTDPSIIFLRTPVLENGLSGRMEQISGLVRGEVQPDRLRVVIYAHTSDWFVQPTITEPLTLPNQRGLWQNSSHVGDAYGALLVDPTFAPPAVVKSFPIQDVAVIAWAVEDNEARRARILFQVLWWSFGGLVLLGAILNTVWFLRRRSAAKNARASGSLGSDNTV